MSTLIAIDTSSDIASVALMRDGDIVCETSEGFSNHSLSALPMLQKLLSDRGVALSDCAAIAFGCGPGSFTGLRTACGVAQGLSFALSLPAIPVVTLLAMAQTCREQTGKDEVLAMIDARMHEVYWAQYRYENGAWQTVIEPRLGAAGDVCPVGRPAFCGNALTAYSSELSCVGNDDVACPDIYPHAKAIVQLGDAALARGKTITAREIEPLYLRNKVALKTAEREALKEHR